MLCSKDEVLVFIIDASDNSGFDFSSFKKFNKVFFETLEPQP